MSHFRIEYRWRKDADWIRPIHGLLRTREEAEARVASLTEVFGDWKFSFRIVEAT